MTNTNEKRRAAIYARIPFPHDPSAQEALDLQVTLCQERAESQSYTIDAQHIYREIGGVLTAPDKREQFAALTTAAKRHEFDLVLVYSFGFLSSKQNHIQQATTALRQHGVVIEVLSDV